MEPLADTARYVWPTARVGVWLDLRVRGERAVSLARVAPDRTIEMTWDMACRATIDELSATAARSTDDHFFTDADLARQIATSRVVLVYLWSPHMPISVDGLQQAERADL